ncbi:MAG: NUDIX domain-containing protein [Muribaculaceae bacterium]|nr:NUDIX domain-containing protein [Muribaculaceae bacterium]
MEEIFPIVDEQGTVIGSATRKECHSGSKLLHPVIHLHIINNTIDALYLQKRSTKKDIQPGKWDTAVGGHIDYGEDTITALRREIKEELGLTEEDLPDLIYNKSYIFESSIERELVHRYYTYVNPDIIKFVIDKNEIDEGRFWQFDEIRKNLGKGVFTPNFESEFNDMSAFLEHIQKTHKKS